MKRFGAVLVAAVAVLLLTVARPESLPPSYGYGIGHAAQVAGETAGSK